MWGAALGLLNLGMGHVEDKKNRRLNKQAMADARDQFRMQMDESIQRRVADAQQAGIHPLFALGASVGASPTISAGGRAPTNNMSRAAASLSSDLIQAQIQKTQAEAALAASQAATEAQLRQSVGRDIPEITHEMLPKQQTFYPAYHASAKAAQPLYVPVRDPDSGKTIRLFNPELGLDEVGQVLGVANISEARARSFVERAWYEYVKFGKAGGDKARSFWSWFKRKYGTQSQRRK
jgi:hypothetical protein